MMKQTSTIATRSRTHLNPINQNDNGKPGKLMERMIKGKRKADGSPSKDKVVKRSALVNLTNNYNSKPVDAKAQKVVKKFVVQTKCLPTVKTVQKTMRQKENLAPPPAPGAAANKIMTRGAVKNATHINGTSTAVKTKGPATVAANKKRLSNEFEKSDGSLYSTALEDIAKKPITRSATKMSCDQESINSTSSTPSSGISFVVNELQSKLTIGNHNVPEGVVDFDKENWNDPFQVSHYAMDIFNYYREKEIEFPIGDYMDRQVCLTKSMRSLLVDWMVEIQESFELNHETLYLGVKLVDMYLDRVVVSKETLQLVGAAAMFIASKFDERIPPMIDDFLYICDGAYDRREMTRMEISLVKVIGFNLGIPISYRFLRRYARCAKITMNVLTLARFILEFNLMEYEIISIRDSKLAAAALYLALRMKHISEWTSTLQFYTGYQLEELKDVVYLLNAALSRPPKPQLMTVRNKYSHKIFFEVAQTPLVADKDLF